MRKVDYTGEFLEFLKNAEPNVKVKINYVLDILINQPVISAKTAKKLTNTFLYEIRIQVNNEYRILCFTIDHDNITQAKHVLFLNAFMKKSTKDYDKQIQRAIKILEQWKDRD
jgi:mRNA-degrading endonuclease RelE of RelBE toxin-antitoxin system